MFPKKLLLTASLKRCAFLGNYVLPVFACRLAVLSSHIQTLQVIIVTMSKTVMSRCGNTDGEISGEELIAKCLNSSLRLARNLCAGVQHNQAMLW